MLEAEMEAHGHARATGLNLRGCTQIMLVRYDAVASNLQMHLNKPWGAEGICPQVRQSPMSAPEASRASVANI